MNINRKLKKTAAIFVLCTFLAGDFVPAKLFAAPAPVTPQTVFISEKRNLSDLKIPEKTGTVQEIYQPEEVSTHPAIILIQDAHAVPEAQQNIRKTILFFEKQYGTDLIALEGAASKLDAQIFKSFPEKEKLKKVFYGYAREAEVSGGTLAALLDPSPAEYAGVEDWDLYQEGISDYLRTLEKEKEITEKIAAERAGLEEEKRKTYPEMLLKADAALQELENGGKNFLKALQTLSGIKSPAPSSPLSALLAEIEGSQNEDTVLREESLHAWNMLTKTSGKDQAALNRRKQSFDLGEISAVSFALEIQKAARAQGIALPQSQKLKDSLKHLQKLESLRGPELMDAVDVYGTEVEDSLIQNEAQRDLTRRSRELYLASKMARLELTRKEWSEVKSTEKKSGVWEDLNPHWAFYENAEKRDGIFLEKIEALLKRRGKTSSPVLLVAGGFHTQGMARRLKEKKIPYAVISPAISSVPAETNYRKQMRGEVSWKNYFQEQKEKVSLYDAFVRGVRDRLLESHNPVLTKQWRDKIILDLAAEKRLADAGSYTRFLDELSKAPAESREGMKRLKQFTDGLRKLEADGKFSKANILQLFHAAKASTPTLVNSPAMLTQDKASARLVRGEPLPLLMRAEGREQWEEMRLSGIPAKTLLYTVRESAQPAERIEAFYKLRSHWSRLPEEIREHTAFYLFSDPDPKLRQMVIPLILRLPDLKTKLEAFIHNPVIYAGEGRDPRLPAKMDFNPQIARYLARTAVLFILFGKKNYMLGMNILKRELPQWNAEKEKRLIELYNSLPVGLKSGMREAPLGVDAPLSVLESLRLYQIWRLRRYEDLPNGIQNAEGQKAANMSFYTGENIDKWFPKELLDEEDGDEEGEPLNPELHAIQTAAANIIHAPAARSETRDESGADENHLYEAILSYYQAFVDFSTFPDTQKSDLKKAFAGLTRENFLERIPVLTKAILNASVMGLAMAAHYDRLLVQAGLPADWRPGMVVLGSRRGDMSKLADTKRAADHLRHVSQKAMEYAGALIENYYEMQEDSIGGLKAGLSMLPYAPGNRMWVQARRMSLVSRLKELGWYDLAQQIANQYSSIAMDEVNQENFLLIFARFHRHLLYHYPDESLNNLTNTFRDMIRINMNAQARETEPEEFSSRLATRRGLRIELTALLIMKGDKESLLEALEQIDQAIAEGAAVSNYALLGFYASRNLMILTQGDAAPGLLGILKKIRRTAASADDYKQKAENFIAKFVEGLPDATEETKELWRNYGRGSLSFAQRKWDEADRYFTAATSPGSGELLSMVEYEHALVLFKMDQVREALIAVHAYLELTAAYDTTRDYRDFHSASALHFYPRTYTEQFEELVYSILAEPHYWPPESKAGILKAAARYLVRSGKMTEDQVYETVTRWINLRGTDSQQLLAETPQVLQILSGMYSLFPERVRSQVLLWMAALEVRHPEAAKMFLEFLQKESSDSLADEGVLKISAQLISIEIAKDSKSFQSIHQTATNNIQNFFTETLIASDFNAAEVFEAVRRVETYIRNELEYHDGLTSISLYSMAVSAMTSMVAALNIQISIERENNTGSQLALEKQVKLKQTLGAALMREFKPGNRIYEDALKNSEPPWRLTFYRLRIEAMKLVELPVEATYPVMAEYISDYQKAAAPGLRKEGELPFITTRPEAPTFFMHFLDSLIMRGDYAQANAVLAVYLPELENAISFLSSTDDRHPERAPFLHVMHSGFSALRYKSLAYLYREGSALREPLRKLLAFIADVAESTDTSADKIKAADTASQIAAISAISGQKEIFARKAQEALEIQEPLEGREIHDLIGRFEMFLLLAHEYGDQGFQEEKEQALAAARRILEVLEKEHRDNPLELPWIIVLRAKFLYETGHKEEAASVVLEQRTAIQDSAPGITAYYNYTLTDFYSHSGQPKEAAEALLSYLRYRVELAPADERNDDNAVVSETLFWPAEKKQKVAAAYVDVLRRYPELNVAYTDRILRTLYFLDFENGREGIAGYLRELIGMPAPMTVNPERLFAMLGWLIGTGYDSAVLMGFVEKLSTRPDMKPVLKQLKPLRDHLEQMTTLTDWRNVLRARFAAGAYEDVIQRAELLKKRKEFSSDAAAAEILELQKTSRRLREISKQIKDIYAGGNYAKAFQLYEQEYRDYAKPAELGGIMAIAAVIKKAEDLMRQGRWNEALTEMETVPQESRDKIYAKALQSFGEFKETLAAVESDLQRKYFREGEHLLAGAVTVYQRQWGHSPDVSQGNHLGLNAQIMKMKVDWALAAQKLSRAQGYAEIRKAALELASEYPEEKDGAFKELEAKSIAVFNLAGETKNPEKKQETYLEAFHLGRLIYELAAEIPPSSFSLARADQVISQAMGNYWLPQLTDDFWITHAMAEAEREKEEVHEAKGSVSFTFPKGKVDFMKHIRVFKLNHSEPDRSGKAVPVNLKSSVEIGDTFRITPPGTPDAPQKPLKYLFKVAAIDEKTGIVSFDIPKSIEKPEKIIREILAALANGGTMTRISNNSWVNQRETLRSVIGNMKATLVSRIDVSDPEASVLKVSTGNLLLNRMLGLSLKDSPADAGMFQKIQQWNADLNPVIDEYVAKEKAAQAENGKNFEFDPEQREALSAILNPYEPVVLIQGPPGTGKTTVLKAAIRLLMQLRQGVLVTSQQNHAIDKVVLKTIEGAGPEEAWLKKLARTASNAEGITHQDILRIYGERIQRLQAMEKEDPINAPGVAVAGTTVGLTQDRELRKVQKAVRKLRTGIMDESSRATRAESFHLLNYFDSLNRLVSVGDPFQLPAYGVTKDDAAFVAQWLGKGPLQDEEMGNRDFNEVFKSFRTRNFKISLFEKTLGLFLNKSKGIDKGIFNTTTPPFFYFDVNRRYSGWLLIKHSNYFYGKRKPLRTEKTEPGYFQLEDTEGLSPESDGNGRTPWGGAPTNESAGNVTDEDETDQRYNLGEVDRSIYWINHFINNRNKSPEKIAVITPFRRQVAEIKKSVLDIAKLHAYLRSREAGEDPPEEHYVTETVERYFRTRVYLQLIERFRREKTSLKEQGGLIDAAANRMWVEYRDLVKDKTAQGKEKARAFREKLGLGENFVKVVPGGTVEADAKTAGTRKRSRKDSSAELADELEGMKIVTVDSSIGDEWDAVIVSWVRSNSGNIVGFLADEVGAQRRNVADSRGAEMVQIMDVKTFAGNKTRGERARPSEVAEWAQYKLAVAREARDLIGDDSLTGLQARYENRREEIFNTVYLKGDQIPEAVKDIYRSLIPSELLKQLGIPSGTKLPLYGGEDKGGENEWAIYLKPLGRGHFRIDLARSKAEVAVNEENPFDDKVFLADVGLRMREDGTMVIETPGRIAPFPEADKMNPSIPSGTERAFVFWVENVLMPFAVQVNARSIEITRSYLSPEALVRSRFVINPLSGQFANEWVRTEGLSPELRDDRELRSEIREIADRRREQADAAIDYLNRLPAGPKVNIYVYNQDSNGVFGGAYLLAREIHHRIKNAVVRMLLVDGRMPSAFRGIPDGIEIEQEFKPNLEQTVLKDSDFNFVIAGSAAYTAPPLPPQATVTTGGYFSRDFHETVFSQRRPKSPIHMDFTNPHSTVQLVTENREAVNRKDQMSFEELSAAKEDWYRRLARDRDREMGEQRLQNLLRFSEKQGWTLGASVMTWTYYKDFTFVFKEIQQLVEAVNSGVFDKQQIWAPNGRQIVIHASVSRSAEVVSMLRKLEEDGVSYMDPLGEIHEGRLPITVVFHESISHSMMQELQVLSGTMKRDEEEKRWIGFPAWVTGWGSSLETMSLGTPWLHDRFDAGEKEFDNAFYALMNNVLKLQAARQLPVEISGMDAEETANEFFLGSVRKAARYEDLKTWSRLSRWLSDSLYQMNMVDDFAIELAKQKGFVPVRAENREQQNPDQQLVNPMLRREGGRAGNLVADMRELLTLYPDSPARAELERAIQQYTEAAASHWKSQSMLEFHGMLHYQDAYDALARFYEQTVLADINLPAETKIHVRTFAPLDPSRIYLDPQWNDRVVRQKHAYHFSQNAYRIRINGKDYLIGKGTYLEFEYPDGTSDFLYDNHNVFYAFAALKASKIKNKRYVLYDEHSDAGEPEAVDYTSQDPFETAQIYHIENFHSGILKDILLKEKGWRWTWVAHHWEEDPEARSFFDDIADFDAFELTEKGGMAGMDLDMLSRGVGSLLSDANIMKLYQKDRGKLIQQLPGFETRAFFISDEHFVKPAAALRIFGDLITEIAKAKKAQSLHEPRVSAEEQRRILAESAEWESKIFLDGKVREDVSQEMLEQARIFYDQINPWDWRGHELDQARKDFHRDLRLILAEQAARSTVQFEYVDLIAHQLANFLNTMQLLGIRTDKLPGHVHEQAEELYRYLKVRIDKATHVMTAKKLSQEEEAADLTKKTTELLMDINRLSTGWKFRKFLKELKEIDDPAFKKKAEAAAATLEKTSSTAAEFARGWLGIEEPKVSSVDLAMTFTRVMRAHPDLRQAGEIKTDLQGIYEIQTYEVYLTEVLLNFLNNAAQALPPASERPRKTGDVTLSARKLSDAEVEITIEDKGHGISPEHVGNILAMKQFTTKETGHGLGMPRAISLVQGALQGSFEIESEVGKGTKITLRFPLALRAEGRQVDRTMVRFLLETDKARRIELARQMGVDTRLSLANYMDPAYVGYAMEIKKQINPENRPMTAVYGGAGAGWPIFALSTNATEVYMVENLKPIDPLKLEAAYLIWDNYNITARPAANMASLYINGYGAVIEFNVLGLELSIMEGLKAAGVSRTRADGSRNIQFQTLPDGSLKMQFLWAYPGEEEKLYTLIYVKADITQPAHYPEILRERLSRGIDLYYQRASLEIPEHYREFLPQIAAAVRPGGFLVTDDTSMNLETGEIRKNNPDDILEEAGGNRWGKRGEILTPSMEGFGEAIKLLRERAFFEGAYGWEMEIRPARSEGRKVDRTMVRFLLETDKARRIELARQMGVDTRLSLANYMDPAYVGYAMALKQQVNPENRPLTAVYGGAGAGWPIFALSTNATEVYMVDTVKQMNPLKLEALYQQWDALDITADLKNPFDMAGMHYKTGFGSVIKFALYGLEPSIIEGLKAAGVSKLRPDGSRNIQIQTLPDGSLKIQFHWAYPGAEEKLYTITYVYADITKPSEYPEILQERLRQGIDLYYQRAPLDIPEHYKEFLPQIAAAVRPGGFLVTDDYSTNLGTGQSRHYNPDKTLKQAGENSWGKEGGILTPSMDGFGEAIKALRRRGIYHDSPDAEISYGWKMEIRPVRAEARGSVAEEPLPKALEKKAKPEEPSGNRRKSITIRSESRPDPEVEAELKDLLLSAPVFYERKGIGRVVDLSKLSIPREKDYLFTALLIRLKSLQISRIPEEVLRRSKPLLRSVRDQEGYKTLIFVTEQGAVDGFILSRNYEGAWRGFTQMDWIISDENALSGAGTLLMDSWLEELKKNEVTLATWIYRPESLGFFTPYLESRGLPSAPMDAQRFSLGQEILKAFNLPEEVKLHASPRAEMRELVDHTARFILSGRTGNAENLSSKISELKTEGVPVKQFADMTDEAGLRIQSDKEEALVQTAFDWMTEVMDSEGTLAAAFDVPASEKSVLEAALSRLQGKSASRWVAFVPQDLGEVNSGSMLTQRVRDLDRYKPVYAIRNVQIQNADRVARIRLGSPEKTGAVNRNLFYVSPNGSVSSLNPALQRVIELAAGMMIGGLTAREIQSTTDLQTSPADIEQRVLAALLKGDYEDLIPQGKGLLTIGAGGSIRIEMSVFSSLLQQVQSRREMAQSA